MSQSHRDTPSGSSNNDKSNIADRSNATGSGTTGGTYGAGTSGATGKGTSSITGSDAADGNGKKNRTGGNDDADSEAYRQREQELQERFDTLSEDFHTLRQDFGHLYEAGSSVARQAGQQAVRSLHQARDEVERVAEQQLDHMQDRIREQPLTAVSIAAGIGVIVGILLNRR